MGLYLQRLAVGRQGLVVLTQALVGHAQVDVCKRIARRQLDGTLVEADRLGEVGPALEQHAQVIEKLGTVGRQDHGLLQQRQRAVVRAQLLQHHGQLVQHVGVVGLQLERANVGLGGLLHLARGHQRAAVQDELLHRRRAVDQRHQLLDAPAQVL